MVKIVQIDAVIAPESGKKVIFGLGDDSKVYFWKDGGWLDYK